MWTSMTWTNVDTNYVNVKHRTWFVANLGTSYFISSETSELLFICGVYSRAINRIANDIKQVEESIGGKNGTDKCLQWPKMCCCFSHVIEKHD